MHNLILFIPCIHYAILVHITGVNLEDYGIKPGSVRYSPVNLGGRTSTKSVYSTISSLLQSTVPLLILTRYPFNKLLSFGGFFSLYSAEYILTQTPKLIYRELIYLGLIYDLTSNHAFPFFEVEYSLFHRKVMVIHYRFRVREVQYPRFTPSACKDIEI